MLAREIENFVDGLFGSSEFSLRLQDRVAVVTKLNYAGSRKVYGKVETRNHREKSRHNG